VFLGHSVSSKVSTTSSSPQEVVGLEAGQAEVSFAQLTSNPIYTLWALRPPRSIEAGASSCAIKRVARSSNRFTSMPAPSASSFEFRTIATLFSMSSCDQPRE